MLPSQIIEEARDHGYNQAQQEYIPVLRQLVIVFLNNIGDLEEEKEARESSPIKQALRVLKDAGQPVPYINPEMW